MNYDAFTASITEAQRTHAMTHLFDVNVALIAQLKDTTAVLAETVLALRDSLKLVEGQ